MTVKIAAAALTFLFSLAGAAVILLTMLVAMNGYNESDATWGLGAFVILSLVITLLMSLAAFLGAGALKKRHYGSFAAAILPILVFTVVGIVLEIVSSLIGVGIAEFVRVKF